jgi:hypothetical protein
MQRHPKALVNVAAIRVANPSLISPRPRWNSQRTSGLLASVLPVGAAKLGQRLARSWHILT